jgi:3-deoxy-D-manno-octulosonic-acid transferase
LRRYFHTVLLIYNILSGFAALFVIPFFIWKYKLGFVSKASIGIKERLGIYDIEKGKYVLLLSSSVGELKTARNFLTKFANAAPDKKILVLTMTPYGYKYALEEGLGNKAVFAPIDLPFCVEGLFRKVTPEMLILVEGELWPNLIFSAKRKGAKIVSINSRISERSFKRFLWVKEFMARLLKNMDMVCARELSDADKFVALGCDSAKVTRTGNMKYDSFAGDARKQPMAAVDFGFQADDVVFVAGSTREGEERIVIDVYKALLPDSPRLKLIIAPRYPDRCSEIENMLSSDGISFRRRTAASAGPVDCLLVDTIGELMDIYSAASVVFVGGSLFDGAGGHNILEPAMLGKPVVFGKYMSNFREPSRALIEAQAAFQVEDEDDFLNKMRLLLSDHKLRADIGIRAHEVVLSQTGATDRNLKAVLRMLGRGQ